MWNPEYWPLGHRTLMTSLKSGPSCLSILGNLSAFPLTNFRVKFGPVTHSSCFSHCLIVVWCEIHQPEILNICKIIKERQKSSKFWKHTRMCKNLDFSMKHTWSVKRPAGRAQPWHQTPREKNCKMWIFIVFLSPPSGNWIPRASPGLDAIVVKKLSAVWHVW